MAAGASGVERTSRFIESRYPGLMEGGGEMGCGGGGQGVSGVYNGLQGGSMKGFKRG